MQDVLDHPNAPWDWDDISGNPNITMRNILDHFDKPWDWEYISDNKFNHF
jgi:hypothetical protein